MTFAVLAPPETGQSRITATEELLRQAKATRPREAPARIHDPPVRRAREGRDPQGGTAPDQARAHAVRRSRWFWDFANEMVDTLRAVAADAKKRGASGDARAIEARVDAFCEQLEKVQQKDAAT
jgi:hypothetical protein